MQAPLRLAGACKIQLDQKDSLVAPKVLLDLEVH